MSNIVSTSESGTDFRFLTEYEIALFNPPPISEVFSIFIGSTADAGMNINNIRQARSAAKKFIRDHVEEAWTEILAKGEDGVPNFCYDIDLTFVHAWRELAACAPYRKWTYQDPVLYVVQGMRDTAFFGGYPRVFELQPDDYNYRPGDSLPDSFTSLIDPPKRVQKQAKPPQNFKAAVQYHTNEKLDVRSRLQKKYANKKKAAEEATQAATSSSSSSPTAVTATGGKDVSASEQDDAQDDDATKKDVAQQKPSPKTTTKLTTHDQYRMNKAIIKHLATNGVPKSSTTTERDFWIQVLHNIYPFMPRPETGARLLALQDLDVTPDNPAPWDEKWHLYTYIRDTMNFKLDPKKWGPVLSDASEHWEMYLSLEDELKAMMDKVVEFNPFKITTKTPVTALKSTPKPKVKTVSPFPAAPKRNPLAHHTSVLQQPLSKSEAKSKNIFASLASKIDISVEEYDGKPLAPLPAATKMKMPNFSSSKPHTSTFDFALQNSPKLELPPAEKQTSLTFGTGGKTFAPFSFHQAPAPLSFSAGSAPQASGPAQFSFISGATSQGSTAPSFGAGNIPAPTEKPDECLPDAVEESSAREESPKPTLDGEQMPSSSTSEHDVCDDSGATSDGTGMSSPKQESDRQPDGMIEDSLIETFRRIAENEDQKAEESDAVIEEETVALVEEETVASIAEKAVASVEEKPSASVEEEAIALIEEKAIVPAEEPTQYIPETLEEVSVDIETCLPSSDAVEDTTITTPEIEPVVQYIDTTDRPFLSFDFEPLEDLEDWAKGTFDVAFGIQHTPLQLDQTPFHELFDPNFLAVSVLDAPLKAIDNNKTNSTKGTSILRQLEHKSLTEILSEELTGVKVPKQVAPPEIKHQAPTSRGLVITSVSTAPLDLNANVAPTKKTSSISRQFTQTDKPPEKCCIAPSPVWTPLSPTDEAFAPTATDIYHPNYFTQFASILGTIPVAAHQASSSALRPIVHLPRPTPSVRLPPTTPPSLVSSSFCISAI